MRSAYGPWKLECTLAVGGMGVVHRVRHADTGAVAALKTAGAAGVPAKRALRREAAALARLHHRAIVRLVDDGTAEADPWYAMELLDGLPLSHVLRRPVRSQPTPPGAPEAASSGGSPDPPTAAVDAGYALARIAELCHALCHLHAAGLVHCDLKPDNVLVVDGRAILLDFGLVSTRGPRIDRGSLQQDARIAGTAAYMSPERVSGSPFDARADLYAIGCMLYEVVAGAPPFEGRAVEVMTAHRSRAPAPLADRAPEVPPELGALVGELLDKDPRRRPGHAERVLQVLERIGVSVPDWPLPATAPLYLPALRGRAAVVERLRETVRGLAGAGRAVWLVGESGCGKSRLEGALLAGVWSRARVLVGGASALQTTGAPVPAGVPFELFAEPLREIADRAAKDAALAAAVAQPLAALRPWIRELGDGPDADPAPDTAVAARHRLFAAVVEVLDAWLGAAPAVVLLDDLQWADELSVGALEVLLRRLPDRPWLVVGAVRAEADDTHLRGVLAHGEVVRLGRLGEDDVRDVVCDMLGQRSAPDPLLRWVERHSAGNPLLVGECLRAAAADGVLVLVDGAWSFGGDAGLADRPPPASLAELVAARLDGLSPAALEVARAGAVLGKVADLAVLAEVCGRSPVDVERAVDELARRAIAELTEPGAQGGGLPGGRSPHQKGSAAFVHDVLVERVYAATDAGTRAELHRRAAAALKKHGGDRGALARHLESAGDGVGAREAYLGAARDAVGRLQLGEADLRFADALRLADEPEVRLERVRTVLFDQGRAADAVAELQRVVEVCGPDRADVLLDLGLAAYRNDDWLPAVAWFDRAEAVATAQGQRALAVTAASERASVLARLGRIADAVAAQREVLAGLVPEADPALVAGVRHRLAVALGSLGEHAEAVALLDAVIAAHRADGRLSAEAAVRGTRANFLSFLGRNDEAIAEYQAALAIQRRLGNRTSQALLLGNWASALVQLGRDAEAEAQYREVLAIHRETGERRNLGIVQRSLAGFRLLDARLEQLFDELRAAEDVFRSLGDPLWLAHCDNLRAKAHRYLGHRDEARAALDRATAEYRRLGVRVELAEILVHAVHHAIVFGEGYDAVLAELESVVGDARPQSRMGKARSDAALAVARHREGRGLLAGEPVENLPAVLQARIRTWDPS